MHNTSSDAQLYYLHRDYLGSGAERRHFDAWGNIVKITDGGSNPSDKFVILYRGFTGHVASVQCRIGVP